MTQIKACPVTIRPCRPIWWEDGQWWALQWGVGDPGNGATGICPWNPFDLIAACWTFLRWRLPAEIRLRWARLTCQHDGHVVETADFHTRVGVYQSRECTRCGAFLGWFRPDGSPVPPGQSWCAEGHHLNVIFRRDADGQWRCVECGVVVERTPSGGMAKTRLSK